MMKRILVLFLVIVCTTSFGQDKIEGIGRFKLKKTTVAYIDTLEKEKKFDRESIRSWNDFFKLRFKKDKIAEVFADTLNTYNSTSYSHYCSDTRVFYISRIEIAGIELTDTYLLFYKDTLVAINTDYKSEIAEAFKLKYGEPQLEKKETETKCTLKLTGSELSYTDPMYYQYWTNNDIRCTAAIGYYRDSKCEKQTLSYITISINKLVEKINECDNREKDRIRGKQDLDKKKKLDDF